MTRTLLMRWSLLVLFALLGTTCAYFLVGRPPLVGVDDANIILTYARNIAGGHGYVYTPGFERVEGSTSLLWTLLVAAVAVLTTSPDLPLLLVSVLIMGAAIAATFYLLAPALAQNAIAAPYLVGLHLAILLSHVHLFSWGVLSLMDSGLWLAMLVAYLATLSRLGQGGRASPGALAGPIALAAMLPLTRPEGMLYAPALAFAAAIIDWLLSRDLRRVRRYLAVASCGVAVTILGMIGRQWYFGQPFPNTYYAKVSSEPIDNFLSGIRYLSSYLANYPSAAILTSTCFGVAILLLWKLIPVRRPDIDHVAVRNGLLIAALAMLILSVQLTTGGDHFSGFRMLQPLHLVLHIPLLVLAASPLNDALERAPSRPFRNSVTCLVLVLIALSFVAPPFLRNYFRPSIGHEFRIAENGRRNGLTLAPLRSADGAWPSVGVVAAGGVAVTYPGRVYDLLGLNWRAMALANKRATGLHGHSSFNASVFWAQPIDILLLQSVQSSDPKSLVQPIHPFVADLLGGLVDESRFRATFAPATVRNAAGRLDVLVRRAWLESADPNSARTITTYRWEDIALSMAR